MSVPFTVRHLGANEGRVPPFVRRGAELALRVGATNGLCGARFGAREWVHAAGERFTLRYLGVNGRRVAGILAVNGRVTVYFEEMIVRRQVAWFGSDGTDIAATTPPTVRLEVSESERLLRCTGVSEFSNCGHPARAAVGSSITTSSPPLSALRATTVPWWLPMARSAMARPSPVPPLLRARAASVR